MTSARSLGCRATVGCALLLLLSFISARAAEYALPRPDHVLMVIEENKSFGRVIGSSSAPYINSLALQGALFISSYALRHPSQPNYLGLFSGSFHGIGDDSCPHTLSGPNLASSLFDAGLTFAGYSESMPRTGYGGCESGGYVRKHNPWVNFPEVPDSANLPFSSFPEDYNQLPTVSIVVPNQQNDMHDGSIARGDDWLRDQLDRYVQWARSNHGLFILTFDEGNNGTDNRIVTLLVGEMVRPGVYAERIDHYTVLRTLLEMYGLNPIGRATNAEPITSSWTAESVDSPVAVELTSPGAGSRILAPGALELTAAATSRDSSIVRVEFFQRGSSLGVVAQPPFRLALTNLIAGDYWFLAKATDGLGRAKISDSVNVEIIDLFPASADYQGLIYDTHATLPASSGFFSMNLNGRGQFSARASVGGKSYRFAGQLDPAGAGEAVVKMKMPAGSAATQLRLSVNVDLIQGTGAVEGRLIQVTLDNRGAAIGSNALASVFAARVLDPAGAPVSQAGTYTLVFSGNTNGVSVPGGDGVGAVVVDARGAVRFSGALADGTPVSAKAALSADGRWPLYVPLQKGRGMLLGWVTVGAIGADPVMDGCLIWTKAADARARFYPAGFTAETCVTANRFATTAGGGRLLDLTNGVIVALGGNVSAPSTNAFQMDARGRVAGSADSHLRLLLARRTGFWTGRLQQPDGTRLSLRGVVLQDENAGRGFSLGSNRSGLVLLQGE